jgi:hypothetical protein
LIAVPTAKGLRRGKAIMNRYAITAKTVEQVAWDDGELLEGY